MSVLSEFYEINQMRINMAFAESDNEALSEFNKWFADKQVEPEIYISQTDLWDLLIED